MEATDIILVARQVYRELGQGHTERVYQRGMQAVLNDRQVFHTTEAPIPIYMLGQVIGFGRCDLLVGEFAIELKATRSPPTRATGQLMKYISGLNESSGARHVYSGIVINFNQASASVDAITVHMEPFPEPSAPPTLPREEPAVVPKGPGAPRKGGWRATGSLLEEFITLHTKPVKSCGATVAMSDMMEAYQRFTGGRCVSRPAFAVMCRDSGLLKQQHISTGFHRTVVYGSRCRKNPGLVLLG
jgi:GxxExxY protein